MIALQDRTWAPWIVNFNTEQLCPRLKEQLRVTLEAGRSPQEAVTARWWLEADFL